MKTRPGTNRAVRTLGLSLLLMAAVAPAAPDRFQQVAGSQPLGAGAHVQVAERVTPDPAKATGRVCWRVAGCLFCRFAASRPQSKR